ncbi:hypothetical protein [Streptomyces sp. 35G-GA-8]|uniref:hypothetical protein n=1 Tax=Streptomyces sp. 35G-GA-8 TaxID=2939434 RepID=UPI00201E944C|nr:hypothetical protein [Streptomyces sp. 35G-GA-8]MCL7380890.1 hypothetical protein [Streptomyces sp. 35G-GA-8]
MVDGIARFGDEWEPDNMASLVTHSLQRASIYKDPHFLSSDRVGAGAVIPRSVIGQIGGVNVCVSDRATTAPGAEGMPATYNAAMVRRGSLSLLYKHRPIVETHRDILAGTTVVTTNVYYATHRLEDKEIVVLTTEGRRDDAPPPSPRGYDSPGDDKRTTEDEQINVPPAKKPTARSAARSKRA